MRKWINLTESKALDDTVRAEILSNYRCHRGVKIPPSARLWRGVSEDSGSGMATLGMGLYFTCDRSYAALYGKVVEVSRSNLPYNCLRFDTHNDFEIWYQQSFVLMGYRDNREVVEDFQDFGDFVRYIDPDVDGIQIGKGRDAMFVSYDVAPITESLTDWLDDNGNPIPGKVNTHGRPHNWADDTADHLYAVYVKDGRAAAEAEWLRIQERDKPTRIAAVVASGRFKEMMKERPGNETPREIIEHEFSKTGYDDPADINEGYCYFFANRIVMALHGPSSETFALDPKSQIELERIGQTYDPTAPEHWFVYHKGLIYDAEAPEGVKRWQDLPFYKKRSW